VGARLRILNLLQNEPSLYYKTRQHLLQNAADVLLQSEPFLFQNTAGIIK